MKKCLISAFILLAANITPVNSQSSSGLSLSPNEPVQIDGDRLEVFEDRGQAVFAGNVTVVQGDTILKTSRLTIFYASGGEGSIATGGADIETLLAEGGVNIQTGTQVATGETGTYDMRTEVLVLEGKPVVLSENGNVAKGCKLTVEQASGKSYLDGCANTRPIVVLQPRQRN